MRVGLRAGASTAAALWLAFCGAVSAQDSPQPQSAPIEQTGPAFPNDAGRALQRLLSADRRVSRVAFRLAVANRELCRDQGPQWGMTLHSASQYGARLRPALQSAYGIGDAVAVSAIVPQGPADHAGLREGDQILDVDGSALAGPRRTEGAADYAQTAAAWRAFASAPAGGAVLRVQRAGQVFTATVTPVQGCAYDTQVTPSEDLNGSADGRHVMINIGYVEFADRDEDLAVGLGHELAHDVLQHREQLDRTGFARSVLGNLGSSPASINRVEREADYVGLYLVARAGYSLDGVDAYWRRIIARGGDAWFLRWPYPSSHQRQESARATVAEIADLIRAGRPLAPDLERLRRREAEARGR